jgi:hypothetical protein
MLQTISVPLVVVIMATSFAAYAVESPSDMDSPAAQITDVIDKTQIGHILDNFQHQLSRIGSDSRIVACDHILELREANMGRDYSYGASCTISNGRQQMNVLMCDDNMIGKFTLGGADSRTREGIGRFIRNNCPPGG